MNDFKNLFSILDRHDRLFFIFLVFFSIIVSIVELCAISLVMPFISMSMDFSIVLKSSVLSTIYNLSSLNQQQFITYFGIFTAIFYLIRSAINFFYFYLLSKFSKFRYYKISCKLFQKYLQMPLSQFYRQNSADISKNIVNEAMNFTTILSSFLFLISEVFVAILIYILLFFTGMKATIFVTIFFIVNGFFIIKFISPKIKKAGYNRSFHQREIFNILQSNLRNFKIIKLRNMEERTSKSFKNSSFVFSKSNIINEIFIQIPRLYLETVGFLSIILATIFLMQNGDFISKIPIISVFVLAILRLLPSVNRIIASYNQILFFKHTPLELKKILDEDGENLGDDVICFDKEIVLKDINFSYGEQNILNGINLAITKGDKIAFIGQSGSGKTTLSDIIGGISMPSGGEIYVDGVKLCNENLKDYRKKFALIPQDIFLFCGSIEDNIIFGEVKDENRLNEAIELANLKKFIDSLPMGKETIVGENGTLISGGEKQRIAIARAIYQQAQILILDEATSALDDNTQNLIMNEIFNIAKDKTIIIIAHRIQTIKYCNKKYEIKNKKLLEIK